MEKLLGKAFLWFGPDPNLFFPLQVFYGSTTAAVDSQGCQVNTFCAR